MNTSSLKPQPSGKTSVYKDGNLRIILCVTLMAILPIFSINPTLAIIAEAFAVSSQQITLIVTAFLVPVAIGTPIFGFLADRFGRKQILVPSLLLFAIAGALCATAQDFWSLVEWRCLQGFGAASLEAVVISTICDLYTGKRVTTAMALNASTIGVAATIYPAVGGILADLNWRLPFLMALLAIPVAILVLVKLRLPPSAIKNNDLQLKTYVRHLGRSIYDPQVIGLLLVVIGLFAIEFGAFYTFTPVLAGTVMGASASVIGMIFSSTSISLAFIAFLVGLFARRLSEIKLIKVALIIFAVSLLLIFQAPNVVLLLIPSVLIGAVSGMAFPSIQALLAKFAPEGYRAGFMSMNVSVQACGRALGPIIAAIALQWGGMPAIYYGGAAMTLVILVVFHFLLIPRQQDRKKSIG